MNETEELKPLKILSRHQGRARAISMPGLYDALFDEPTGDKDKGKINSTRNLRNLTKFPRSRCADLLGY